MSSKGHAPFFSCKTSSCTGSPAGLNSSKECPWFSFYRVHTQRPDSFSLTSISNNQYFARAFKARYGITPGCFLRTLRIKWAAEQLQTTLRPISEIALASGFADQSHFGRAFKKQYGVSPGVWRRSL
ncbi:MAG: helix-turn-helix domain-containing protein [Rhodothermaceae bacterium]|nr:helix-turn-helix domain-containing protein [Rhodothermaceae bacterium]